MKAQVKAPKTCPPPWNSGTRLMSHFCVNVRGSCQRERHERFRGDDFSSYTHFTLLFDLSKNWRVLEDDSGLSFTYSWNSRFKGCSRCQLTKASQHNFGVWYWAINLLNFFFSFTINNYRSSFFHLYVFTVLLQDSANYPVFCNNLGSLFVSSHHKKLFWFIIPIGCGE